MVDELPKQKQLRGYYKGHSQVEYSNVESDTYWIVAKYQLC